MDGPSRLEPAGTDQGGDRSEKVKVSTGVEREAEEWEMLDEKRDLGASVVEDGDEESWEEARRSA